MLKRFTNDMKRYWRYTVYSTKSQLKAEVANSYLSWVWWLLEPFCFMLIYWFIFGEVFKSKELYFPIFIFLGNSLWGFFQKNVNQSVKLVKLNKAVVSKVYLPKYILLLSRIGVNGFKTLLTFIITGAMLFFFHVPLTWNVLYIIPILITLTLVTFGICCFLMHYGVYIEDLTNIVNIALRFLLYMTGIFWNIMKKMPAPYNAIICKVNPIAFLLYSARQCILYSNTPQRKILLLWFVIGVVISILGIRKIYKNENSYVKVI